jgi:hypothetical protein
MIYLPFQTVKRTIEDAIYNKKILRIKYQNAKDEINVSLKAPFDIGTTTTENIDKFKNNLYAFCINHKDSKTGLLKPMVHPISALRILSIEDTGEIFDEEKLTTVNLINSKYNYKTCKWAIAKDRKWF